MAVKDGKSVSKRQKKDVSETSLICPHCKPTRTFTSRWYTEQHIKDNHRGSDD